MKSIYTIALVLFFSGMAFANGNDGPEKSMILMPAIQNMDDVISQLVYPVEARQNAIEGKVTVQFIVDKNGKVVKSTVTHACDPLLKTAMSKVMDKFEFTPASVGGEPAAGKVTIPFKFTLEVE